MGNQVLGFITKGVVHTKIDALVNHRNSANQFDKRAAFLQGLLAAGTIPDYLTLIEAQAAVLPAQSAYLRNTWYNTGPGGWWPGVQPIFQRIRWGLIKAIQEAGTSRLLDSYWCPAGDPATFQVLVMRSLAQVTRIILTPWSPVEDAVPRLYASPAWALKARRGDEHVGDEKKGIKPTETATEFVESVIDAPTGGQDAVVVWRVREWDPQPE